MKSQTSIYDNDAVRYRGKLPEDMSREELVEAVIDLVHYIKGQEKLDDKIVAFYDASRKQRNAVVW